MVIRGTKEYRQDMAAIHEHVARTGEPAIVTKDGEPHVKIVPATEEATLERLERQGVVRMPTARRAPVEPIDAGGDDSTSIISEARR